jgi:hypothetical protein
MDIDFQGTPMTRAVVNLQGLVVPDPGLLLTPLDVDGSTIGYWGISCEARPAQIRLTLQDNHGGEIKPTNRTDPKHDRLAQLLLQCSSPQRYRTVERDMLSPG